MCSACLSADAWDQAERIVITHADVHAAEARRRRGDRRPILPALTAAAGVALAVTSIVALTALFRAQPLRGLDDILADLEATARTATLWGLASFAVGALALWRQRRVGADAGRAIWARRLLLTLHLSAVAAGGIVAAGAGLHWAGYANPATVQHLTMPALSTGAQGLDLASGSLHMARIAQATVVVIAPDAEGNARQPAIGTGVVVDRDPGGASIATCVHVAMPYTSAAAPRDLDAAVPVWIQLADGRSALGRVTWAAPPPVDVALVRIEIDAPPEPVPMSPATDGMGPGAAVMFVPNPYRDGWMIHHGEVERRRTHDTAAGSYALLYTDLPVQPGDSGSGLFDGAGRLIGLNTWTRINQDGPRGISLPSETLRALIDLMGRDPDDRAHDAPFGAHTDTR
ncbi:S1 family peptidase [Haliangium sp.]|uniref:S1 family peptidase n=1 Tax=Haliangium sp. TaxID=2663208 RepID=UPI003D13105D